MKRALVTGGSSPIGAAICQRLASSGLHVIVHANSRLDKAQACVEQIHQSGGSAEAVAVDLCAGEPASETLAQLSVDQPVQVFVHCVGRQKDMPFAAMTPNDWTSVIDINLNTFFSALRPLILPMIRSRWGRVIAVSSLSGVKGNRGQANYAAAKGGFLPLIKSLTYEYGSRGITANVVSPGLIETDDTAALENYDKLVSQTPIKRAGYVNEVAALIEFLVGEEAGFISGQQICIDGGAS